MADRNVPSPASVVQTSRSGVKLHSQRSISTLEPCSKIGHGGDGEHPAELSPSNRFFQTSAEAQQAGSLDAPPEAGQQPVSAEASRKYVSFSLRLVHCCDMAVVQVAEPRGSSSPADAHGDTLIINGQRAWHANTSKQRPSACTICIMTPSYESISTNFQTKLAPEACRCSQSAHSTAVAVPWLGLLPPTHMS